MLVAEMQRRAVEASPIEEAPTLFLLQVVLEGIP
jgi:hypothetical protein